MISYEYDGSHGASYKLVPGVRTLEDQQLRTSIVIPVFEDRLSVDSLRDYRRPLTNKPRRRLRLRVSLDYQRKLRFEVKVWTVVSLSRIGLNAGDRDRVLSTARNNRFVRTETGATNEIGDQTYLPKLTGKAEHWSELAPGFGACKTANQICQAVDFDKCKRISRNVTFHRNALRSAQHKKAGND
jgi:hypothetical protein